MARRVAVGVPTQVVEESGDFAAGFVVLGSFRLGNVERFAQRSHGEGQVGGPILGLVGRHCGEDPLQRGDAQAGAIAQRANQPQPCDVVLVVLGLVRCGGRARGEQTLSQVVLDRPHRDLGPLAQLGDPHPVTPFLLVRGCYG